MTKEKKLTIEEINELFTESGYYANEEILYDTFNALCLFEPEEESPGQDIYAICLDGPPGAGKTRFAESYVKLLKKRYPDVAFVDYQCDKTTGKTELFEDINVVGAVTGKEEKINIPGYLVRAIELANQGKKVILFIDEYDKAREETDSFFLKLLQSGKINTNQHGDLAINDEFKKNLQVIFCRNEFRTELSGPLTRRLRILSLDYMPPERFYQVAENELVKRAKKPVATKLLNLVALIYEAIFEERELFSRLPAASEMMIAISDANRLMTRADAPQHIIYKTIVKNLFKTPNDLATFEGLLEKGSTEKFQDLNKVLSVMKEKTEEESQVDIKDLISKYIFEDYANTYKERLKDLEDMLEYYTQKFKELEQKRTQQIADEVKKIGLAKGKLVAKNESLNVIRVFEDETAYIKRGMSVFDQAPDGLTQIANMTFTDLSHHDFYDYLIKNAPELDIQIFEDGVVFAKSASEKLILVNEYDENKQVNYRFFATSQVIPLTFLKELEKMLKVALRIFANQKVTTVNSILSVSNLNFECNALVFDNTNALASELQVEPNIYNYNLTLRADKEDDIMLFPQEDIILDEDAYREAVKTLRKEK